MNEWLNFWRGFWLYVLDRERFEQILQSERSKPKCQVLEFPRGKHG